ncbi:MAG: protoporphyrinogen oxidase [Gammaproteobacteria bacterium]|jgi:oxygen-dependent protoporphyrinogen oxidase|nr:protoporphyrinogen oxidase [Gammaproteobacteria bacterium]NCF81380.1 protoporphyrinogen oxidase [Pseudomonadota bacterium]
MNDVDVLVVGGGISGLASAWWLARGGLSVAVWERAARPGGKIRSHTQDGYTTERAAALVMNFRPEVNQLLTETGLDAGKILRGPCANRYLVRDGRLLPLPMKLGAMFASPMWSRRARLRMALEPFIPRSRRQCETVAEFVRRRLGQDMLEQAMEPYVAGPLASSPELAEAQSVLPRLTALEQRYGSLALGVLAHKLLRRRSACASEAFSFAGGTSDLVQAIVSTSGIAFQAGCEVTALEPVNDGWRVSATRAGSEYSLHARQLVLSVPAHAAASLLSPLDAELGDLLGGIEYAPLSVVHLGLDRTAIRQPLDGTGFLVPRSQRESRVLTGNLWMSSLFPAHAPNEKALLTSYLGGARRPQAADWDDERSVSRVLEVLEPLLGLRGAPEMVRIDRHRRALPLYHGAYQARMLAIDERLARLPGLRLAANYRDGVSIRDRVVCGHTIAMRVCAAFGHRNHAGVDAPMSGSLGMAVSQ